MPMVFVKVLLQLQIYNRVPFMIILNYYLIYVVEGIQNINTLCGKVPGTRINALRCIIRYGRRIRLPDKNWKSHGGVHVFVYSYCCKPRPFIGVYYGKGSIMYVVSLIPFLEEYSTLIIRTFKNAELYIYSYPKI